MTEFSGCERALRCWRNTGCHGAGVGCRSVLAECDTMEALAPR